MITRPGLTVTLKMIPAAFGGSGGSYGVAVLACDVCDWQTSTPSNDRALDRLAVYYEGHRVAVHGPTGSLNP